MQSDNTTWFSCSGINYTQHVSKTSNRCYLKKKKKKKKSFSQSPREGATASLVLQELPDLSIIKGLSSPEMTDSTKYEYLHSCILLQITKPLDVFVHVCLEEAEGEVMAM